MDSCDSNGRSRRDGQNQTMNSNHAYQTVGLPQGLDVHDAALGLLGNSVLNVSRHDWFSYIFVHRPGAGLKLPSAAFHPVPDWRWIFFIPALLALYVPNDIK